LAMATAIQTQRDATKAPRRGSKSATISFSVDENNAGEHRWSVLDGTGKRLAQSEPFATPAAAQANAELVRGAAGAAEPVAVAVAVA
jgi:uncharacterized protein YegP (UPF0339 family)